MYLFPNYVIISSITHFVLRHLHVSDNNHWISCEKIHLFLFSLLSMRPWFYALTFSILPHSDCARCPHLQWHRPPILHIWIHHESREDWNEAQDILCAPGHTTSFPCPLVSPQHSSAIWGRNCDTLHICTVG